MSAPEGLSLWHSLCLRFNNHLKHSKLAAPLAMQRFIYGNMYKP